MKHHHDMPSVLTRMERFEVALGAFLDERKGSLLIHMFLLFLALKTHWILALLVIGNFLIQVNYATSVDYDDWDYLYNKNED